jgi:hypothetical protein
MPRLQQPRFGRTPDLVHPKGYNEKIRWRMLYDRRPLLRVNAAEVDPERFRGLLRGWLARDYFGANGRVPSDYKFYCFDGEPRAVAVCHDRFRGSTWTWFDPSWNILPWVASNTCAWMCTALVTGCTLASLLLPRLRELGLCRRPERPGSAGCGACREASSRGLQLPLCMSSAILLGVC